MLDKNDKIVKPKALTKSQKNFIMDYVQNNQKEFTDVLEEIRYGQPTLYAKLYVEMTKMVIPKESNVNVNVGIHKDFRDLHTLATTRITQKKVDGEIVERLEKMGPIEDVDYELMPKETSYAAT